MTGIVAAMLAEGRLPFVRCAIDGETPAEVASDGREWVVACGACAGPYSMDEIVWLLPSEAAKRGWWVTVVEKDRPVH
jgi:hypothetical protein